MIMRISYRSRNAVSLAAPIPNPNLNPLNLPPPIFRILLAFSLLTTTLSSFAQDADSAADQKLEAVAQFVKDAARYDEAAAACRGIADDAQSPAKARRRAYDMLIDLHSRRKDYPKAIAAAEALRLAFPDSAEIDRHAIFKLADQYAQWKEAASNSAPAVAALQAFTQRHADDADSCYQALLRIARLQTRAGQYDEALTTAKAAFTRAGDNLYQALEALGLQHDIASQAKRPEDRLRALEALFDERYRDIVNDDTLAYRRTQYADALRQLQRTDDLLRYLEASEREDASPARRQRWCYDLANTLRDLGRTNEALVVYERVFTSHPTVNTYWNDAQTRMVDLLYGLGRDDDALRAAHVLYDTAAHSGTASHAIQRMLMVLRRSDPRDPRAVALEAMNRYGPAGKDSEPGTADDPQPVLPALGYPDTPSRRKAFDAASPTLGDGASASLQRGWFALYTAEPKQAISHFADALRRAPSARAADIARVIVQNGFRPLQGHSAGLEPVANFLAYGPSGADGQAGTADDLPDPFPSLGVPSASAKPGGLVPLPEAQVGDLQSLIAETREFIRRSDSAKKKAALIGLYERALEALVSVDRPETLAWVKAQMQRESDGQLLAALARFGATVARSDQLHLAAASHFYADLARAYEQKRRPRTSLPSLSRRRPRARLRAKTPRRNRRCPAPLRSLP
jgi:tetratricopeptide (TPR) repeat protein